MAESAPPYHVDSQQQQQQHVTQSDQSPMLGTPVHSSKPRILFLDAYDSFTNNIVALLETSINAEVEVIRIDDLRFARLSDAASSTERIKPVERGPPPRRSPYPRAAVRAGINHQLLNSPTEPHHVVRSSSLSSDDFTFFLQGFDAVVAGPGPGNPSKKQDVGLIAALWALEDADLLPVLGICLGFQSMCLEYGGQIQRLREPRHGIITEVIHNSSSIFKDIGEIQSTQYHSLHIDIGHAIQTQRGVPNPSQLWKPSTRCPLLEPLAWDCSDLPNGAILMAAKHRDKPFWGVQYHPESICTNEEGAKTIANWWADAQSWLTSNPRKRFERSGSERLIRADSEQVNVPMDAVDFTRDLMYELDEPLFHPHSDIVHWKQIDFEYLTVREICEVLHIPAAEVVLLESAIKSNGVPLRSDTGRYSIIGCFIPDKTLRLCYYQKHQRLDFVSTSGAVVEHKHVADIWKYLNSFMKDLKARNGPGDSPFWGGLMGFVTYEAGLNTIGVTHLDHQDMKKRPDISFAMITRSIVIDHHSRRLYVQSIRRGDFDWLTNTETKLRGTIARSNVFRKLGIAPKGAHDDPWQACIPTDILPEEALIAARFPYGSPAVRSWVGEVILKHILSRATGELPSEDAYCSQVRACQEAIRAGDSYELCLTDQTVVKIPAFPPEAGVSWHLYRQLMEVNPAPFGAYMRLGPDGHGVHILSSSPERFLSWTREGICQFRPIKGTVAKKSGVTRRDAEEILNSSKEQAENLMIADLIRHDLHGVVGAGNVRVPQLMGVEEYETVYQLVTVIEGDLNRTGFPDTVPREDKDKTPTTTKTPLYTPDSRRPKPEPTMPSGIDVLAASLPPGSMTGAPKRRSCEILRDLEQQPRGIYSGVLGYMDVGGGGDFSVVIRTAVHWDGDICIGEDEHGYGRVFDVWRVGAGGAVTVQSTPEGEYDEMVTKRNATLQMFAPPDPPAEPSASKGRSSGRHPIGDTGWTMESVTDDESDDDVDVYGELGAERMIVTDDEDYEYASDGEYEERRIDMDDEEYYYEDVDESEIAEDGSEHLNDVTEEDEYTGEVDDQYDQYTGEVDDDMGQVDEEVGEVDVVDNGAIEREVD